MAGNARETGAFGEDYAVKYLKKHHYHIIERNFHSRFGEIDIIARSGSVIAFVEVKTRGEGSVSRPCEAVDFLKRRKCIKTALYYLALNPIGLQPRFDVSEIVVSIKPNGRYEIREHNYIENAFSGE